VLLENTWNKPGLMSILWMKRDINVSNYFDQYESRVPPKPLAHNVLVHSFGQIFLLMALVIGAWYIHWRWTASLNFDALWVAIPLVVAETGAYIGLILFVFNIWHVKDYDEQPAPSCIKDCVEDHTQKPRPITVDVFFPTYDEDIDLVRLSLIDANRIKYPHDISITIHVLDDGDRPAMKKLAREMGCQYITRNTNIGFKAGNMRNAMEQTSGDFIVICDADTRPFPTILEHTLGYFRDPDVAWVQTPQWFFDLPEGETLTALLHRKTGPIGQKTGALVEKLFGEIRIGADPFVNDPKLFYDVILRRRNWANAAFCCGAGSIHRREAVMQTAVSHFGAHVAELADHTVRKLEKLTGEEKTDESVQRLLNQQALLDEEFTPYKFHVSEDIYTSIELHSDTERNWKSVQHPQVESKMLSPQDLLTWTVQRFKYAGGTLDIAKNDDFLFRKGLDWKQRLMYGSTVWSYLGGIWNVIFLMSPMVFLFFAIAPVDAYSMDFYKHILPFLFLTELGTLLAIWGLSGFGAKNSYLSFFPLNLKAMWTVARGEKISFPVTSKVRQDGNFLHVIWPQFSILCLTGIGILYAWTMYLTGFGQHAIEGLFINTFWGLNNMIAMSGIVYAAFWKPRQEESVESEDEIYQEAA